MYLLLVLMEPIHVPSYTHYYWELHTCTAKAYSINYHHSLAKRKQYEYGSEICGKNPIVCTSCTVTILGIIVLDNAMISEIVGYYYY